MTDLGDLRRNYTRGKLSSDELERDPFKQFELWFQQASQANLCQPNAMSLATATAQAKPSLRTVLLKYFDRVVSKENKSFSVKVFEQNCS